MVSRVLNSLLHSGRRLRSECTALDSAPRHIHCVRIVVRGSLSQIFHALDRYQHIIAAISLSVCIGTPDFSFQKCEM